MSYRTDTTPTPNDTETTLLIKILNVYQSRGGAKADNNHQLGDTKRVLLVKILRAIQGLSQ